ncbi:MAG: histidinol-phosphate transaminase [Methanobrevibacter sp.]|jgi:histidinol-phosphate aminotransferase|nr:histidinol-phosphate transaminase [Methanobrevibacter sp.]
MKVRNVVNELDPYVPGRSQDEIAQEFNLKKEDIIKLGSNENPWGPSEKAIKAIKENLNLINRYPETNLDVLKQLIAEYSNVKIENIIVGGDGADEIIDVLAKTFIEKGDEFIVPLPSYTYYEFIFKPYGAIPVYGKWDLSTNTLNVDSILDSISEKTKMIFLCTPNNPTGAIISKNDLEKMIKATDALIVIDEAYIEYSQGNNVDLMKKYDNVFIMRTMSKVLGLAGMRVGYGLSNPEIIEYMHRIKPVFSLTRTSYIAAIETFKDKKYIEESIAKGIESRDYLYDELSKIENLNVFKSYANYILVGTKETGLTAAELSKKLLEKGIIVRDCTSFKGLDEYWIRVSIAKLKEDKKFIAILKEVLKD